MNDGATEPTLVFAGQLFRTRKGRAWTFTEEPPPPAPEPVRRPARVAKTLAMAHAFEAAIARGEFRDRADLARRLDLTRARVTQILNLVLLAPDIQEAVLSMEAVDGVEPSPSARCARSCCARAGVHSVKFGPEPRAGRLSSRPRCGC